MINKRDRPEMIQIDMTTEGEFLAGPRTPQNGVVNQMLRIALLVAGLAAMAAVAVFSFWVVATLIPIAIGAGLVAYGIIRYRLWQAGRRRG